MIGVLGRERMDGIFISYRRDDTLSATGRLADKLAACFGTDEVFRDIDDCVGGADFHRLLLDTVRGTRVMLVVVGRHWASLPGPGGAPRLNDPDDYVRLEIETALASRVPIVPVLVEGARLPHPEELPASIRALTGRQAHEISESRWEYDTDRLVELVARSTGLEPAAGRRHALDAGAVGHSELLALLARVPADFLRLFYEPRRFLSKRGQGTGRDLLRALLFVVLSQIAGATLVLQEWPTSSSILQFLFTPVLFVVIGALAISLPLYLAWRIAGAPREYWRVLVILLYQCAVVGLGVSLAMMVTLVGLNMVLPAVVSELAREPTIGRLVELVDAAASPEVTATWLIAPVFSAVLGLVLLVWLVATWGAYGDALRQSRLRSAVAFVVFALFCTMPLAVLGWIVRVLAPASGSG